MFNDLIDKTINVLKVGGLEKFERGPSDNINKPHCIMGAFDCVLGGEFKIDCREYQYLLIDIKSNIPKQYKTNRTPGWDIVDYNNAPNTTVQDVIDLLERSKDVN
jgi:hypothetical protein